MIQFLLSLLSISYVTSFNTIIPINNKLIKTSSSIIENPTVIINSRYYHNKYQSNISMLDLGNCVETILNNKVIYDFLHDPVISKKIVVEVSNLLPNFDSIGHIVLHYNEVLINKVLAINWIDDDLKKKLVLNIIEACRRGDDFGSKILLNYYKLVDYLL